MKRLLGAAAAAALAFALCLPASAAWEADYAALMIDAAAAGDDEAGRGYARVRDEKIASLRLEYAEVDYDDMLLLAQVIHTEAGSSWLPDEWRLAVGEVVLNRVASPEFPNTLEEVVYQPGQYSAANRSWFDTLVPFRSSVEAAFRLLSGERVLNDPSVVFQSGAKQGSGVALELTDSLYGSVYFCYSSRPHLY